MVACVHEHLVSKSFLDRREEWPFFRITAASVPCADYVHASGWLSLTYTLYGVFTNQMSVCIALMPITEPLVLLLPEATVA